MEIDAWPASCLAVIEPNKKCLPHAHITGNKSAKVLLKLSYEFKKQEITSSVFQLNAPLDEKKYRPQNFKGYPRNPKSISSSLRLLETYTRRDLELDSIVLNKRLMIINHNIVDNSFVPLA